MPGEILTISAGQCGNQVGEQYWSQLCKEHGISSNGTLETEESTNGMPQVFFRKSGNSRFTPRALLIDMEPSVVNGVRSRNDNLFNPRNCYISPEGRGAGNIWTQGFEHATRHVDEFLDMIDKELDFCDSLESFQLIHSVSGGTGSGLGSFLLETLSDRYSKKLLQTHSIFPDTKTSDVVVQPYNVVLTLKRLIQEADATMVFDNPALMSIANSNLDIDDVSIKETNQLISTVISTLSSTIRFPSYSYNSTTSILSTLIPTPDLHFLIPSYTPFTQDFISHPKQFRKTTGYDIILELLDPKLQMIRSRNTTNNINLSVLDFIRGDVKATDVQKALVKAQQRIQFVPWTGSTIHLALAARPPKFQNTNVTGMMVKNSTEITGLFESLLSNYNRLRAKNAFIANYEESALELNMDIKDELDESYQLVLNLIDEYSASKTMSYVEDSDVDNPDDDLNIE
ncbi:hypothetical protein LJB42_000781 [Komagataella kurtzmanii]|nr:hypothetical protein LJB42_000781 [Komagataella kurtzmanii]